MRDGGGARSGARGLREGPRRLHARRARTRRPSRELLTAPRAPRSCGQGRLCPPGRLYGCLQTDGHRHASEWLGGSRAATPWVAPSRSWRPAEAVSKLPELEDAFRSGELSAAQAKEVAGAAICRPHLDRRGLIGAAKSEGSQRALRRRCAGLKAASCLQRGRGRQDQAESMPPGGLRTWTAPDGTFWMAASARRGRRLLAGLKGEEQDF